MSVANAVWTNFYLETTYTDLDTFEVYGKVTRHEENFLAVVMPPELPLGHQIQVIGIHNNAEAAKLQVEQFWQTRPPTNQE